LWGDGPPGLGSGRRPRGTSPPRSGAASTQDEGQRDDDEDETAKSRVKLAVLDFVDGCDIVAGRAPELSAEFDDLDDEDYEKVSRAADKAAPALANLLERRRSRERRLAAAEG
jgi:hypothetical protein